MGCGKSKNAVATENTVPKSKNSKSLDEPTKKDHEETITNDTNTDTLVQEKPEERESKKDEVMKAEKKVGLESEVFTKEESESESKKDEEIKAEEKVGLESEVLIKKESEEGEEMMSQNAAANEQIIRVGVCEEGEKSMDEVEEKGLDEEEKTETTNDPVADMENKEEVAVPTVDTQTLPDAAAATTTTAAIEEIVPESSAEELKTI